MPNSTVGVDISKTHLDVYVVPAGQAARFPNDVAGFKALIAWIEVPVRAVTYEPTGRWHRAFEEALLEARLPLVRVNPLHARRFAQAIGQRAKTDAVDARVLAQMGAAVDLRPTAASSSVQRAAGGARRAGQRPHRRTEPPEAGSASVTEAAAQASAGAARPASGRHRYRDREAAGRRRGTGPADRDPDVDPGRVSRHRGGPADPDAGARPPRRQGGRQLGGPRPRHSAIRRLAGPQLHPGWPGAALLHEDPAGVRRFGLHFS